MCPHGVGELVGSRPVEDEGETNDDHIASVFVVLSEAGPRRIVAGRSFLAMP
jgi:hypothetical protein